MQIWNQHDRVPIFLRGRGVLHCRIQPGDQAFDLLAEYGELTERAFGKILLARRDVEEQIVHQTGDDQNQGSNQSQRMRTRTLTHAAARRLFALGRHGFVCSRAHPGLKELAVG